MAGITMFYHVHFIDGERVVHSHPYAEKPDTGNHRHTTAEIETIAHLSQLLMLAATLFTLAKVSALLLAKYKQTNQEIVCVADIKGYHLRAPPVACLIF